MEEEDDYDDFGDELEEALDDKNAGEDGHPSLPIAPTLPAGQVSEETEAPAPDVSAPSVGTADEAVRPNAEDALDPEAERARQMQEILQSFTEDQLDRFEAHRRSSLNKKSMKRLLQAVTGHNPNTAGAANVVILLCGVAKMFVGELVEEARILAAQQGNSGALQPRHVHEAFQAMEQRKVSPLQGQKRRRRV